MTAQTIEDIITVQPIQPASGLSACPGQDVTLNCTIVRMTTLSGVEQPALTLVYRNVRLIYRSGSLLATSDPLNNGVYTAVFNYSNFFVASTVTIINVLLSHHKSSIQCTAPFDTPGLETITIAGTVMLQSLILQVNQKSFNKKL